MTKFAHKEEQINSAINAATNSYDIDDYDT